MIPTRHQLGGKAGRQLSGQEEGIHQRGMVCQKQDARSPANGNLL